MNLIETGYHEVHGYGNPDLCLHRILGSAIERFDTEVLLDPFEKQFDLPTAFVDACDYDGDQAEMIGDEDKAFACFDISEANATQLSWVIFLAFGCLEPNCLVTTKPGGFIDFTRLRDIEGHVTFCACNKEGSCLMNPMKSSEINVSAIHNIDTSRFESNVIENVHVVDTSVCNTDEYRDRTFKVDHRMQFDRSFCVAKIRPREHGQAKINCRGVQRINDLFDVQSVGVAGVKAARPADKDLSQLGINPPVPVLIGIGQIRSCYIPAELTDIRNRHTGLQSHLEPSIEITTNMGGPIGYNPSINGLGYTRQLNVQNGSLVVMRARTLGGIRPPSNMALESTLFSVGDTINMRVRVRGGKIQQIAPATDREMQQAQLKIAAQSGDGSVEEVTRVRGLQIRRDYLGEILAAGGTRATVSDQYGNRGYITYELTQAERRAMQEELDLIEAQLNNITAQH